MLQTYSVSEAHTKFMYYKDIEILVDIGVTNLQRKDTEIMDGR